MLRAKGYINSKLFVLSTLLLLGSFAFGSNKSRVTISKIIEIKREIAEIVLSISQSQLRGTNMQSDFNPLVNVSLEIDEDLLDRDYKDFMKQHEEKRAATVVSLMEQQKKYIEDLNTAATRSAATGIEISKSELRLGMLNIDLKSETLDKGLGMPPTDQLLANRPAISISAGIPDAAYADAEKFEYDPMDYIRNLSIAIRTPQKLPPRLEDNIKQSVLNALELKMIKAVDVTKLITFSTLSPEESPVSSQPTWIASFANPQSGALWHMMASLTIGILLFFAAQMMSKVFSRIASGISELKPAPEEKEEAIDVNIEEHSTEDGKGRKSYDAAASVNALTSEMKTIREQLGEAIQANPNLAAELIRDLLYETNGFDDFRDVLGFAGYTLLKPAMDLLPRSNLDELSTFIEDHRQDPSSLLNGVEVAQRIYRDCISRFTDSPTATVSESAELTHLRNLLVKTEDRVLQIVFTTIDAKEAALIINLLTVERGNILMKDLQKEQIREACQYLDVSFDELLESIRSLVEKIEDATKTKSPKVSQKQRRFILRMARRASLGDEESVKNLLPEEDWDLKRQLMETRFFFSDLIYVAPPFLKDTLETFPGKFRGEFLHLVSDDLRQAILATYVDGTKIKEMLTRETDEIRQNSKRMEALEKAREAIISRFMEKFRSRLVSNPEQIQFVIMKQCQVHNLQPPAELRDAMRILANDRAA